MTFIIKPHFDTFVALLLNGSVWHEDYFIVCFRCALSWNDNLRDTLTPNQLVCGHSICQNGQMSVKSVLTWSFAFILLLHKQMLAQIADMEWQTPAVSEKFQSRFGRRPGTSDSGDTGLGTSASDSTEGDDFSLFLCCPRECCVTVNELPLGWKSRFFWGFDIYLWLFSYDREQM